MAIRWEDIKEKSKEVVNEFRGHTIGVIGLSIIVVLLIIGLLAPVIAPGVIGHWEDMDQWRDVPNGVPPTWWDYFTSDDFSPHEERFEPDDVIEEEVRSYLPPDEWGVGHTWDDVYVNYTYDYQYDVPPTNLALHLDVEFYNQSEAHALEINLIRPDDRVVELESITVDVERGYIDERFSLIGRNRETIYNWADDLGVTGEHAFDMDPQHLEGLEAGRSPTPELSERFGEEGIILDEMLFSLDLDFEEELQEGVFPDELREEFEAIDLEFYDEVVTLGYDEFGEHLIDGEFIYEDHPIRDEFEISENATFYYDELEESWWIASVYEDEDTGEFVIDNMEYRLDVSVVDEIINVFEFTAELEYDEDDENWYLLEDGWRRSYRLDITDQQIEVYPNLIMRESDGIWSVRVGPDVYRMVPEDDKVGVYIEETIPRERVNYARTLFGKADSDLLSPRPSPLNGEYTLQVNFISDDVEFNFGEDSGRLIIMGSMYGLMGTDNRGRDIALGWVHGARYALLLAAIIGGTTITIGTLFGMTSAYLGGWKDEIMQRINEIVIGIPILPILIIMMFIWRQSFWVMVGLMTMLYWRGIAKTIRARGLQIRQETYVEAAGSLGAGSGRIITTHMVPQILPYSMAEGALLVPAVVIMEASLSVLGLGDPQLVTWGKLLSEAQGGGATIRGLWWWVLLPGLGITLLGFGFIAVGMAIERVVNPKMKQR